MMSDWSVGRALSQALCENPALVLRRTEITNLSDPVRSFCTLYEDEALLTFHLAKTSH
jgi:hypothetical protein